jgi:hypothetical protein
MANFFVKKRASINSEDELALFVCRLVRHGVDVLPCGGGVISEPKVAIERLANWYSRDDLERLCLKTTRGKPSPAASNFLKNSIVRSPACFIM